MVGNQISWFSINRAGKSIDEQNDYLGGGH